MALLFILLQKLTFYDAVNVTHDVITTADPIPYTAKFMFDDVRNNKTQQIRHWKVDRIGYVYSVAVSILPISLDIFDMRQHYIRILYVFFCNIWLVISVYLSLLPVAHLSDAPRRRLVVTGDSARIQDETTENSTWFFNVLGV